MPACVTYAAVCPFAADTAAALLATIALVPVLPMLAKGTAEWVVPHPQAPATYARWASWKVDLASWKAGRG